MKKLTDFMARASLYWSIAVLVMGFVVKCFWVGFKIKIDELKLAIAVLKSVGKDDNNK